MQRRHGGEAFYRTFETIPTPKGIMEMIMARGRNQTEPDQWQIQIFARVLMDFTVIMVTSPPRRWWSISTCSGPRLWRRPCRWRSGFSGKADASVTVIPDGVAVIVDAFSS
jgi:hypothetical protein